MILGFGSIETAAEVSEGERVTAFLGDLLTDTSTLYFTSETISALEQFLEERKVSLDSLAAKYKLAETFPERYCTFYFTVLHDASNIVVVFQFSHVNRRHPMSPDGWAMLQTTYLHHDRYEEVAL